jgi:hypothetical protein
MAYGTTAGVQALLPVLGTLSGSTTPTSTTVSSWLVGASAIIDRHVSGAGYTVPVSASATCYAELAELAHLYAAAQCVMARSIDNLTGETEDRATTWLARFYDQLKELAGSDLSMLGCTVAASPSSAGSGRRRVRTLQMRRVDGYSAKYGDATENLDIDVDEVDS